MAQFDCWLMVSQGGVPISGIVVNNENVPSPLPSRMLIVSSPAFSIARSGIPSSLKSPTPAIEGLLPVWTGEPGAAVKVWAKAGAPKGTIPRRLLLLVVS